jgi:hypothetical protein
MRIFLIAIFCFTTISVISPLTFAKEIIKLHNASDFNNKPSSMNPSFPVQPNSNSNNKTAPTNTEPTQIPVQCSPSTLSMPTATAVAPPAITTPSSTASPSNAPTTGSVVLLDPTNNSSKNAAPGSSSWVIH